MEFLIRTHICAPETADEAMRIAERMRKEYPWSNWANDVKACARNYKYLMNRIETVKVETVVPCPDMETDDAFEHYWRRELGEAFINYCLENKILTVMRVDDEQVTFKMSLPVVHLHGSETLYEVNQT